MNSRTKAGWLLLIAVTIIATPYIVVFGFGSVWLWRHGWLWLWAIGTGGPTLLGFALAEWARRIAFPAAEKEPYPSTASTAVGLVARQAVRDISQRLQAKDLPLDKPDVLEKTAQDALVEVLDTVARLYHPESEQPILEAPITHIAAMVEMVARDFRQTFSENVPWGNSVSPRRLIWWKEKGQLAWQISEYLWQLNRIRRLCMRPATAIVQEVQDHWGQNLATKSVSGLKNWAIDYCVTKTGDYAIQLYSGHFVLDDESRPRVSERIENAMFEQEPLQVLVVGQVKTGKSSLINALLGSAQAPVDVLPTTNRVDLYECEPEGLPPIILRDTPGYGAVGDKEPPLAHLRREIEECDLLLMVCSANSAARQADRKLLEDLREHYRSEPRRIMPPVIYVVTHIDKIPDPFVGEAAQAVAGDLEVDAESLPLVCVEWNRRKNIEGLLAAIARRLPEAERLKCLRCVRQLRKEQDEDKLLRQLLGGLRLAGGWIVESQAK